jgi:hypothetical protein
MVSGVSMENTSDVDVERGLVFMIAQLDRRAPETNGPNYHALRLAMTPYAVPSILVFAKPTHILTGFDYPHAPLPGGINSAGAFNAMPLTDEVRGMIMRENDLPLGSRFAKK